MTRITPTPLLNKGAALQERIRPCGHGLTGRRVRQDLFRCQTDACSAARRRVLDRAEVWRPNRGTAADQVLIATPYGDAREVAEDVALYAAGFDAVWAVLPESSTVIMARASDASLFRAVLAEHPDAITEDTL